MVFMFDDLIRQIDSTGYSDVIEWRECAFRNGIRTKKTTAAILPVDDYVNLDPSLETGRYSIFRLGTHGTYKAHFAIVRMRENAEQFILHEDLVDRSAKTTFIPDVMTDMLDAIAAMSPTCSDTIRRPRYRSNCLPSLTLITNRSERAEIVRSIAIVD